MYIYVYMYINRVNPLAAVDVVEQVFYYFCIYNTYMIVYIYIHIYICEKQEWREARRVAGPAPPGVSPTTTELAAVDVVEQCATICVYIIHICIYIYIYIYIYLFIYIYIYICIYMAFHRRQAI